MEPLTNKNKERNICPEYVDSNYSNSKAIAHKRHHIIQLPTSIISFSILCVIFWCCCRCCFLLLLLLFVIVASILYVRKCEKLFARLIKPNFSHFFFRVSVCFAKFDQKTHNIHKYTLILKVIKETNIQLVVISFISYFLFANLSNRTQDTKKNNRRYMFGADTVKDNGTQSTFITRHKTKNLRILWMQNDVDVRWMIVIFLCVFFFNFTFLFVCAISFFIV